MYKFYTSDNLETDELFLELLIDEDYDRDVEDIIRPYREDIMSENNGWGAICE